MRETPVYCQGIYSIGKRLTKQKSIENSSRWRSGVSVTAIPTDPRNLWPEPYNTHVGGVIMGARQKDVVEAFVHDKICQGIPGSKNNSYIPGTTSITLKRGLGDILGRLVFDLSYLLLSVVALRSTSQA